MAKFYAFISQRRCREFLVISMMAAWTSYCCVYWAITKIDSIYLADTDFYISMSQGVELSEIPAPFKYRVLTPYLASLIDFDLEVLKPYFQISEQKIIALKFGIVNAMGLMCAGVGLFYFSLLLGLRRYEALLCQLLFYCSYIVINWTGIAMVDAWAFAMSVLCYWAILANRPVTLAVFFALALFFKETTCLTVLAIFLLRRPFPQTMKLLAACLPGVMIYAFFRYHNTVPNDAEAILQYTKQQRYTAIWTLFDGFQTFGVFWLFAILGWRQRHQLKSPALVRMLPLALVIFVMPFIYVSSIARIWFNAFPFILPLAVLGLRSFTEEPKSA